MVYLYYCSYNRWRCNLWQQNKGDGKEKRWIETVFNDVKVKLVLI